MSLAKIMTEARKSKGLKLREVAQFTKLKVANISAIENGRIPRPKMETLYKLIVFYGIDFDKTCIAAQRVPQDCFYKIIHHPELLSVIRNYKA